jgi:hypothetical protein
VHVLGPEVMPGYMYNARGHTAAEELIACERRLATDAKPPSSWHTSVFKRCAPD